jgi:predicted Rossmann fold flavoprotein
LLVEYGQIVGVKAQTKSSDLEIFGADRVIVATGGKSYPGTGSTGDGYELANFVGHSIVPPRPALVPLETKGDISFKLQGLSLKNVNVKVIVDGKKVAEAFGEMLFTHFGVSGPIILSLSKICVDALLAGKKVAISIDLKPALNDQKLDQRILRDFSQHGKKQFQNIVKLLLPQKLIPVCAELTGIEPEKLGNQITAAERKRLRLWLKDFQLEISGHRSFNEAIITAGGVALKEIDPRTMESRLVKGLYFAGEVLDIDADTGGYNLQAAFSTGWVAGRSAAKSN